MATIRAGVRMPGNMLRNLVWAQGWDRKDKIPQGMEDRAWWAAIRTRDAMMVSTSEWERRAMELLREVGHLTPNAKAFLKGQLKRTARVKEWEEQARVHAHTKVAAMRESRAAATVKVAVEIHERHMGPLLREKWH